MIPRWCPVLLASLAVSLCPSAAHADGKFGKIDFFFDYYYYYGYLTTDRRLVRALRDAAPDCVGASGSLTHMCSPQLKLYKSGLDFMLPFTCLLAIFPILGSYP